MLNNESLSRVDRNLPQQSSTFMPLTLELEAQGSEAHFSLATFWHVVLQRAPTILIATAIMTALTALYTFTTQPVYRAIATIEVEAEVPQLSINEVYRQAPTQDDTFLPTQIQVLKSDNLAWQTMGQLGLNRAAVSPGVLQTPSHPTAQTLQAQKTEMIADFKDRLVVEPLRDSRILEVGYESPSPELSARVVNQLVSNYIDFNFQERYDFARRASGGMEQQLEELKAKVEESQQAMFDYERQNLITSIGDKGSINDERLEQLNKDYTAAESDRAQKQSVYELAKQNEAQVGIIVQDALLERLEEKYGDLKAAYADALTQYGPNFPKVVRLREQLAANEDLMQKERQHALERAHHDYLGAVAKEKILHDTLEREKVEKSAVDQRMIEHNILKREFETNQQLYANLLQRMKDAALSVSLQATNVHIIDQATPPMSPIRPNARHNLPAGLLVGLILGITLAFVQDALDSSVRSTEEAERLINAPALAVIPFEVNGLKRRQVDGNRPHNPALADFVGLTILSRPNSPLAESYRSLRTSIMLSTAPRPPQTLLVTSAQVGEGKTSTASNLAMSFAQRGGAVLIVDADLRRPSIAKTLGMSNEKGLSSYLTGAHSLDEVLIQYDRVPNLWVLPAGPRPPDPAELLSSPMMEATLKDLLKRFTQIIVDSPPLLLVTDAVVLSAMVDGVVLVVESGTTARGALARAHRILGNAGSRLLGMVLNKVDMRFDTYYGYHYGPYHRSYYYYDEISVSNPSHSSGGGRPRPKDSPRRA